MSRYVAARNFKQFQRLPIAPGGSMQHERDMLHAKSKIYFSEFDHFVMAITAAEAITRHIPTQPDGLSYRMLRLLIAGEDSDAQGRYCRRYDRSRFRILGRLAQQRAGPFAKSGN